MATLTALFPPAPETRRGYRCDIDCSDKRYNRYAYTNGNCVYIRSFDNPSEVNVFNEHRCPVLCARFSPNGEWIASGDSRGRVIIWSIKTHVIKIVVEVNKEVFDVNWSHDGQRLVAVGDGNLEMGRAFIWNTGNQIGIINGHSQAILTADFKPSRPFRIASGAQDNLVNFFKGPPFKLLETFEGHKRYANCIRYSPDGSVYISAGADKKMFLFDGKTGKMLKQFATGHKSSIASVSWNPNGKEVITASLDKTARIWNVESGECVEGYQFVEKPTVQDQQVGTMWHKNHIVTVNLRGDLFYIDRAANGPGKVVSSHQLPIRSIATHFGAKMAFTGDTKGRVMRWEAKDENGTEIKGKNSDSVVVGMAVDVSGERLCTVSVNGSLMVNDCKEMTYGTKVELGGSPAGIAASTSTTGLFFVALKKKLLLVVQNGAIVATCATSGTPSAIAVAPNDQEVAVACGKVIEIFTVNGVTPKPATTITKHQSDIVSLDYSLNGQLLASADKNRYVFLFDNNTREAKNSGWRYHSALVSNVHFSPDSSKLMTSSLDGTIFAFTDLQGFSKDRVKITDSHFGGCAGAKFIDNKTLISAGHDRIVKIWTLP